MSEDSREALGLPRTEAIGAVKRQFTTVDHNDGETVRVIMHEPKAGACGKWCGWRTFNFGQTVVCEDDHEIEGEWAGGNNVCEGDAATYTKMWDRGRNDSGAGLKDGYPQLCHIQRRGSGEPTPDEQRAGVDRRVVACQCASSVVLQQREAIRQVENGTSALSLTGAAAVAADMLGRRVFRWDLTRLDVGDLLAHAHPALFDDTIGSPLIPALSAGEIARWRAHLREAA